MIVNDGIGPLRCGTDDGVGVAAVIGTYCAVGARNAAGEIFHLGFWPDSTGAYALGSEALAAIWRNMLGLAPPTSMLPRALELWNRSSAEDLLHVFTRIDDGLPAVAERARFAAAVLDEAEEGDVVARDIVRHVGGRAGDYARVSAERTGQLGEPFPLVLLGGVLRHPSPLLRAAIHDRVPESTPVYPDIEPVVGALLLAADSVGARPDRDRIRDALDWTQAPGLMDGIRLEATTKVYPNGVKAIDNVTLDIHPGEFMVLVGPSGCGKSTLLRMIAGLEEVTEGRILIGDRDVTRLRPRDRDIAMVFQNYALYPHMTVEENLGFGLKLRRVSKAERKSRVDQVADTLGLKALMGRRPAFLSGGQRQRVAMGRAMVREPKAFLMDEPLSNLDAKLRVAMRGELTRLHDRLGVTTVFVTHDQVEAMTLGQRVAVMLDGVLQQCDTPQKLFHRPANLFVAAFMGSPAMNVVEAEVADGQVRFAGLTVPLAQGSPLAGASRAVILGVRPTDLRHPDEAPAGLPRDHGAPGPDRGARRPLQPPLPARGATCPDRRHAGRDRGHRRRRRDAAGGRPPGPLLRLDRRAAGSPAR